MTKEHPGSCSEKKDSWHLGATHWKLDNEIYALSCLLFTWYIAPNLMSKSQHSWEGGKYFEYLF